VLDGFDAGRVEGVLDGFDAGRVEGVLDGFDAGRVVGLVTLLFFTLLFPEAGFQSFLTDLPVDGLPAVGFPADGLVLFAGRLLTIDERLLTPGFLLLNDLFGCFEP
jgi:hypothetical protein